MSQGQHGGIALEMDRRTSIGEQARRLARLDTALAPEEMADRLEFLGTWTER